MSESYVQEPASEYGNQIPVENLLDFPYVRLGQKVIEAIPIIGRDAFVTYCALLHYADRGGICWPTYTSLMHLTGFGRKKLMKSLKSLCDHKLLKRTQMRKGKEYGANRYTLLPLEDWYPSDASEVPNRHHQAHDGPSMVVPNLDRSGLDRSERHHKLDPVLTRSKDQLDPEDAQNARAREAILSKSGKELRAETDARIAELQPGLDILHNADAIRAQYKGEKQCASCNEYESLGHVPGCVYAAMPDACAVYHPGFPCEHERAALHMITQILWGPGAKIPKSHPSLYAFIHSDDRISEFDANHWKSHLETLARWWRTNRKPKDWSIPLMFSRPEEVLATAQCAPPDNADDPVARYLSRLTPEELGTHDGTA